MNKLKEKIIRWFTDKRVKTLMIIPHNGTNCRQMAVPIWGIRLLAILTIVLIMAGWGCYSHYRYIVNKYDANQMEIHQLRKVNFEQAQYIEKLNKNTIELQEKFDKLKETDKKIQQLIN